MKSLKIFEKLLLVWIAFIVIGLTCLVYLLSTGSIPNNKNNGEDNNNSSIKNKTSIKHKILKLNEYEVYEAVSSEPATTATGPNLVHYPYEEINCGESMQSKILAGVDTNIATKINGEYDFTKINKKQRDALIYGSGLTNNSSTNGITISKTNNDVTIPIVTHEYVSFKKKLKTNGPYNYPKAEYDDIQETFVSGNHSIPLNGAKEVVVIPKKELATAHFAFIVNGKTINVGLNGKRINL